MSTTAAIPSPGASSADGPEPSSSGRPSHPRAGRVPLPALVVILGVLGGCAIVLPLLGLGTRVGWGDLPAVLSADSAREALGLSLRTCVVATLVSVLLGVPLALLLARQWPGVRLARVLAVLPMTMPPVVAGIALLATLGKRGVLGPSLEAAGLQVSFTTTAVVIAQVFVSMPYLVVTLEAALRSRDTRPETIAQTLGAGPWRVLTRITLPLAAPALARGTALALGRSLGEFGATIAFAGSKEGVTRTMPLAIYLERESDTPTALALAIVLIVLSFFVVGATTVPWRALPRPTALVTRRAAAEPAPPVGSEEVVGADDVAALQGPGDLGAAANGAAGADADTPRRRTGQAVHLSFTSPERDVALELDVPAGGSLALIGPNGSGKSTACAVLAGLLGAEGGEVRIGSRTVDGPGVFVAAGRRGVALLAQSPGVFTHMSVLDNVAFGPSCRGLGRSRARRRAMAELAAVGAAHLVSRPGSALSGGQAARVALARALATDPRVLVLDEPMAALDVAARQEMRALVARRVREEGLTLLLVTHDVLDLTALADDVLVLEAGRAVERGTTEQVLTTPVSGFAAALTGTSVLSGTLEEHEDARALLLPGGQRLTGRPEPDTDSDRAHGPLGEGPGGPAGTGHDRSASGAPGSERAGVLGGERNGVHSGDHAHSTDRQQASGVALVPPDAVALYPADGTVAGGSPRNALPVRVTGLDRAGSLVTVRLQLEDGQALTATVTAGAVAELGIEPGRRLIAVVKAVQVRVLARGRA